MARSRAFRGRTPRRRGGWEAGPRTGTLTITAASQTVFSIGQSAELDGLTIVRTRGEYSAFISAATTALDGFEDAAIGFCVVSQNAAGIGVTAIPDPLADEAWDGWFMHQYLEGLKAPTNVAEFSNSGAAHIRGKIDTKGMRKLRETDVVVGVLSVGTEIGGATMIFNCRSRLYVKLP